MKTENPIKFKTKIELLFDDWNDSPSKIYEISKLEKRFGAVVVLINPPHIQDKKFFARVAFEPVGLAYVAASLEKAGYKVFIIDAIGEAYDQYNDFDEERCTVGLSFQEISNRVEQLKPNYIGIGAPFTVRAEAIYRCAEVLKSNRNLTMIPIFSGGIHCSTYPVEVLSKSPIDYVIQGEGEVTATLLLDTLLDGGAVNNIPNLGYRDKDNVIKINERSGGIEKLDEIPHPARHLLPMKNYIKAAGKFRSGRGGGSRFASITTSRGCPLECSFCTTHDMMGRKYRYRSPENVLEELLLLKKNYEIEEVHFEDDQLTIRKERFEKILDLMISNKLNIKWDTPNGVLATSIAEDIIIEKMKKAGCWYICVAPESGDQYVVDKIIKKRQKLTKVDMVVKKAAELGIRVDAFFVIGNVGETKQQIQNSIDYGKKLRSLGAKWCHFHIATPFDGTPLYKLAELHGYLVHAPKGAVSFAGEKRIQTGDFSPLDVDEFYRQAHSMNPRYEFLKVKMVWSAFLQEPKKVITAILRHLRTGNSHLSQ